MYQRTPIRGGTWTRATLNTSQPLYRERYRRPTKHEPRNAYTTSDGIYDIEKKKDFSSPLDFTSKAGKMFSN